MIKIHISFNLILVPYDDNLIQLNSSYINASMISLTGISQKFIATMAPKPKSVSLFWQMIIDKNVRMLYKVTEY